MKPYLTRPPALPSLAELRQRRARRAQRKQEQFLEPAPNVLAPFDLPSMEELERLSQVAVFPIGATLIPVPLDAKRHTKGDPGVTRTG